MDQNDSTFAAQNEKAKSEIVAQIARIVRRAGLDYQGWFEPQRPKMAIRSTAEMLSREPYWTCAWKGRPAPKQEETPMSDFDFDGFYDGVDTLDDGFDHGDDFAGFQPFDPDIPNDEEE